MPIFNNKEVKWARLGDNAEDKFDKSKGKEWSVSVVLSDEEADKWTKLDFFPKVKTDLNDGTKTIKFHRDCVYAKSGDPRPPITVVDQYGDPMNPNIIGNGSICNIQWNKRDWDYNGSKGTSADILAVQVMDLKEFTGGAATEPVAFEFATKEAVALSDEDMPF